MKILTRSNSLKGMFNSRSRAQSNDPMPVRKDQIVHCFPSGKSFSIIDCRCCKTSPEDFTSIRTSKVAGEMMHSCVEGKEAGKIECGKKSRPRRPYYDGVYF